MSTPSGNGARAGYETLEPDHERQLLVIADHAVRVALRDRVRWVPAPDELASPLAAHGASFVTLLDVDERLLGCIGSLEARRPLAVDVAHHAVAAAFDDPRLPPLTHDEYERMTIEVSVLSPLVPLDASSYDELGAALVPGVDGVLVEAGVHRATFLPAVWHRLDGADEFLTHLWVKAGIPPGTWPAGTRVWRYTTRSFHSPGPRPAIGAASAATQ